MRTPETRRPPAVDHPAPPGWQLSLLGDFSLRCAQPAGPAEVRVSGVGQRLLALLALHRRPVRRSWAAAVLWQDTDDRRAATNLRATLHRLPHPADGSPVRTCGGQLVLSDAVRVDVDELARRSVEAPRGDDGDTLRHIGSLEQDVLPDWYEEWVVAERERFRQLRLHALESLAERLTASHRYALAVHAALAAVHAEPLRESAHRAVIEAHLAEGNVVEAVRQYRSCQRHLSTELAISPSPQLQELVFGDRRR